jgi:flagellar biosynthetic protein FliR
METLVVSISEIEHWIDDWFMIFARIGALFSIAPFIGSRLIPVRMRVIAALLISLVVFPLTPALPAYELFSFTGLSLLIQQMLIGLAMGFILQLVFNAATIAGEVIAMTMGLGFAQMVDPQNGVQVPVVSQLFVITATLLFLALDGHITLLAIINESFYTLPVAPWNFDRVFSWTLLAWTGNMFSGAVLIAVPIVTGLLIANFTMGVIARSAPQLNIFAVGFPATMTIGFVLILLATPAFLPTFESLLQQGFDFMRVLTGAT